MKSTMMKIWQMLKFEEKKTFVTLTIFTVVGAILEMLSLSLIVPATSILVEPDRTLPNSALTSILNDVSSQYRVIIGMITLVSIFALKNLFNAVVKRRQFSFQSNLEIRISEELLTKYLRQPYTFHLKTNSSEMGRNLIDVAQLIETTIAPMLLLLSEFLVIVGITALLLVIEPKGFIAVVIVFSLFGLIFTRWSNRLSSGYGLDRNVALGRKIKAIQECLQGIKEIQIYSRESTFIQRFSEANTKNARANQKFLYLKYLPTYFLEIIVIGSLGFLASILVISEKSPSTIVTTLAVFGAAAFRILPSLNRIINAIQSLRFGSATLENVVSGISLPTPPNDLDDDLPLKFENRIVMRDICFKYDSESTQVIKNANLSILKGTSLGIIGSSGAGKSTIIDLLLGLHPPSSGCIEVDGVNISNNISAWRRNIGYVPQEIFLSDLTIRENIAFGYDESDIDDLMVETAIKGAQLETFVSKLEHGINSSIGENGLQISGGERQRIGIARALYSNPKVLVLDEATSALDVDTEEGVMQAIEMLKEFMTVIIVTHRINSVRNCEKIALVKDGDIKVFQDFDAALRAFLNASNTLN